MGLLTLTPSDQEIATVAAKGYGISPEGLCQILQAGVSFWATQVLNESSMQQEARRKTAEELAACKRKTKEISALSEMESLDNSLLMNDNLY